MKSQRYRIAMHTPLGKKSGKMLVFFDGNNINGEIELLQQKVPFEGNIREDGRCEIFGCLKTLMTTIRYKAVGEVTPDRLYLDLNGEHAKLIIQGEPMIASGEY